MCLHFFVTYSCFITLLDYLKITYSIISFFTNDISSLIQYNKFFNDTIVTVPLFCFFHFNEIRFCVIIKPKHKQKEALFTLILLTKFINLTRILSHNNIKQHQWTITYRELPWVLSFLLFFCLFLTVLSSHNLLKCIFKSLKICFLNETNSKNLKIESSFIYFNYLFIYYY